MPLTDRDPNVSDRTSRESNISSGSCGYSKDDSARSDMFSSAPGVMSMLRTSTELGDVGSLMFNSPHLPSIPRPSNQRGRAASRMSTSSSHSQTSRRTSSHQAWPSASSDARRSLTRDFNVPQYLPETLSPTIINLQGSSPLIPRSRMSRDGRSFSMTHTSQPAYMLSSNRSFASLRNNEMMPRPRSPFKYPTRLRRPGYRPTSPAMSDITGAHPRRVHGQSFGTRLGAPSSASLQPEDRNPMAYSYHQGRNRSTTSSSAPLSDPMSNRHMLIEQTRNVHTPAKGSMCSGLTNPRTESDAPSSDPPSDPPTPKDGTSMEVLISPTGTQVLVGDMRGAVKLETSNGPLFYDYSEQFEEEIVYGHKIEAVPMGFVHRVKTILEERATFEQASPKFEDEVTQEIEEVPASDLAELPATPVPKRIARDMILVAIEPALTTGEMTTLCVDVKTSDELVDEPVEESLESPADNCSVSNDVPISPAEDSHKRQSIMPDVPSHNSVIGARDSTFDLATRYSIPIASVMEDKQQDKLSHGELKHDKREQDELQQDELQQDEPKQDESKQEEPKQDEPKQDETKQNETKQNETKQDESLSSVTADRSSKASDWKSCESCKETDAKSCKDSDSKSFRTCQDTITPDMPSLIPTPRLNSKPSSTPASVMASSFSSAETIPRPPSVIPPRDSSSSKEAQRSTAVADFLVRLSRSKRFTRESLPKETISERRSIIDYPSLVEENKEDRNSGQPAVLVNEAPAKGSTGPRSMLMGEAPEKSIRPMTLPMAEVPEKGSTRRQSILSEDILEKRVAIQQPQLKVEIPERFTGQPSLLIEQGPIVEQRPIVEQPIHNGQTIDKEAALPSTPVNQVPSSTPYSVFEASSSGYASEYTTPGSSSVQTTSASSATSKEPNRRDSNTTTHLTWNAPKPLPPKPLPPLPLEAMERKPSHRLSQDESTTDLRLSMFRYPLAYLPDVKEELHEDSSINTSASNLKSSGFKFPVARRPSASASVDGLRLFKNPSVKSYRTDGLAQTRNLPSLNFSRIDLFSKLSDALDLRSSRSMDDISEEYRELFSPVVERRSSSGEIRAKYRSFFASLDELGQPVESQQPSPMRNFMQEKRPYSPRDIMTEIEQLTVPSVGGLTQRFSEYLPSFKRNHQDGEHIDMPDEINHALEDIHEIGAPTLNSARSSARLRAIPGHPNLLVIDDGVYEELTHKDGKGYHIVDSVDSAEGSIRSVYLKESVSRGKREKTPLAELEAPMRAMLRPKSLSLGGSEDLRASLESRLSSRSLRSLVDSPADTRPWNLDKNYPWSDGNPAIDISLPAPTIVRNTSRPGPSRLRLRLSGSSDYSDIHYGVGDTSLGSPAVGETHTTTGTNDPFRHHPRRSSRLSVVGSITCRIGIHSGPFDTNGYANGPDSIRHEDRTVDPGDRYPTTGLTPPSAFNLEEVRSFFSDDSSQTQRGSGLRKRLTQLTNLKAKLPPVGRTHSAFENRSVQNGDGMSRDSRFVALTSGSMHTFDGTVGMSRMEFRARKGWERIKTLWFRSGELFRSMSRRKNKTSSGETRDWLHDNDVYSGT
ncbi:hypothetical protein K432DRAFT_438702 [Lepidopterella palustris CBS 459.81]|uniref:Uncharacterized protein n=1 Tax=Lepidopterella palustris CBS 459.81 TaxID=1314670 RepID=A0A8E2ELM7_9PEZI|nr:hypothetical protein K432DRAFT_438702 [Lepidopterella palustris CBS 459.81]